MLFQSNPSIKPHVCHSLDGVSRGGTQICGGRSILMPQGQWQQSVYFCSRLWCVFFLFFFFQKPLEGKKIMKYACGYGLWAAEIKQSGSYQNEKTCRFLAAKQDPESSIRILAKVVSRSKWPCPFSSKYWDWFLKGNLWKNCWGNFYLLDPLSIPGASSPLIKQ